MRAPTLVEVVARALPVSTSAHTKRRDFLFIGIVRRGSGVNCAVEGVDRWRIGIGKGRDARWADANGRQGNPRPSQNFSPLQGVGAAGNASKADEPTAGYG